MSKKVLILGVSVVLLFLGVMGGGFYVMLKKMTELDQRVQAVGGGEAAAVHTNEKNKKHEETESFNLDSLIVNLADGDGSRYLRISMVLEVAKKEVVAELEKRKPQLKNIALMLLPMKKFQELNSTEGKKALRDELMAKMNEVIGGPFITDIFFTEFVVQ
jgi:flagellar protein FliL